MLQKMRNKKGDVFFILVAGTFLLFCGASYLNKKLAPTRTVDTIENPAPAPWSK